MSELPGEDLAKTTVDAIGRNAMNPWWVIGFLLIGCFGFICMGVIMGFVYVIKPASDAQVDAVKVSIEAIKSNAETNKRTASAVDSILEMQKSQAFTLDRVVSNVTTATTTQNLVLENQKQTFAEHKVLLDSARQGLEDHKRSIDLLLKSASKSPHEGS